MKIMILKNFTYPGSKEIRDKIRAFHRVKLNDGRSWPGDRGDMEELTAGRIISNPPSDLVDSWIKDGLAEEVV